LRPNEKLSNAANCPRLRTLRGENGGRKKSKKGPTNRKEGLPPKCDRLATFHERTKKEGTKKEKKKHGGGGLHRRQQRRKFLVSHHICWGGTKTKEKKKKEGTSKRIEKSRCLPLSAPQGKNQTKRTKGRGEVLGNVRRERLNKKKEKLQMDHERNAKTREGGKTRKKAHNSGSTAHLGKSECRVGSWVQQQTKSIKNRTKGRGG